MPATRLPVRAAPQFEPWARARNRFRCHPGPLGMHPGLSELSGTRADAYGYVDVVGCPPEVLP